MLRLSDDIFINSRDQMEKISTRDGYGKALLELGKQNKNVVALDADLSDSTRSEYFAKQFPERFFSMGIAEQNMIGAAAGLAFSGKIVYASTFAIFSERAYEFTRNIISRNRLNVKIAGSHAGIATGEDGKSAQAIEDIAIYRVLPNMIVLQPCDSIECERMVFELSKYDGPSYMRMHRNPVPVIHSPDYKFQLGKGEVLRQGRDAVILETYGSGTTLPGLLNPIQFYSRHTNNRGEIVGIAAVIGIAEGAFHLRYPTAKGLIKAGALYSNGLTELNATYRMASALHEARKLPHEDGRAFLAFAYESGLEFPENSDRVLHANLTGRGSYHENLPLKPLSEALQIWGQVKSHAKQKQLV